MPLSFAKFLADFTNAPAPFEVRGCGGRKNSKIINLNLINMKAIRFKSLSLGATYNSIENLGSPFHCFPDTEENFIIYKYQKN